MFKTPANLLGSFFGVIPSPLGDTLTLVVFVLSAALLPIVCIRFFLLLTRDDGTIVIEAEGRP